jgi:hypothetical protein
MSKSNLVLDSLPKFSHFLHANKKVLITNELNDKNIEELFNICKFIKRADKNIENCHHFQNSKAGSSYLIDKSKAKKNKDYIANLYSQLITKLKINEPTTIGSLQVKTKNLISNDCLDKLLSLAETRELISNKQSKDGHGVQSFHNYIVNSKEFEKDSSVDETNKVKSNAYLIQQETISCTDHILAKTY